MLIGLCPQLGRTERVRNCSSPEFSKTLQLEYHFETVQKLRFGIYDIDNKTPELGDDDFLGGAECSLGQVRGARDGTGLVRSLSDNPDSLGHGGWGSSRTKQPEIFFFSCCLRS